MKKLLYDDLVADAKLSEDIQKDLGSSHVFLIQNILNAVPDQIDPTQLPQLSPPYENCWFEWTLQINKNPDSSIPDDFSGVLDDRLLDTMLNLDGAMRLGVNLVSWHDKAEGWYLFLRPFMKGENNRTIIFPYRFFIKLNSNGYLPDGKLKVQLNLHENPDAITSQMIKDDDLFQSGFINPVLYSLALSNCKNVVTQEIGNFTDRGKRNRYRKWKYRHYVMQIRPMQEVTKHEHIGDPISKDLSFHFCRGHFKTYTEEKPLFGKYIGTFHWNAYTRGSIKSGIVSKDYNIN